jgi:rhodanese-related sulfurtransferase
MTISTIDLPPHLDVAAVQRLISDHQTVHLIDVRTPAEYATAHIAGSHNIPLDTLPAHRDELLATLGAPVVLLCRTDNRSRKAAEILQPGAARTLHIMTGGVTAWAAAGYPLRHGQPRWSLERQVRGVAGVLMLAGIAGSLVWKPALALAGGVGAGLSLSALTDSCAMGMLLGKLPYNRGATCDVPATLKALRMTQG